MMVAGTVFLLKESSGSLINTQLCKISAGTADTVKSITEKMGSCSDSDHRHHCLPSISTPSSPPSDGQPSLLEVHLVPLCSLWSGHPDLTNSVLLSDESSSVAQLLSEQKGYTILIVPKAKVCSQENEQDEITEVNENLSNKQCLEGYNTSVSSQLILEGIGTHLGCQITGSDLPWVPGVRGQERHEEYFTVGGTRQKVGGLVSTSKEEEDSWIDQERVSETEFEDEDGRGDDGTKMTNRQGIFPELRSLLMLRSSHPEAHQATPLTVESDRQESEHTVVGEELSEPTKRIQVEHIPSKQGASSPQQFNHASSSTPLDRYSQSQRQEWIEIVADSSSDEDLPSIRINSPHKVSSPLPSVYTCRTTSSECHSCPGTLKDVILISGSEDEPVKPGRGVRCKAENFRQESKFYGKSSPEGCRAPTSLSPLPSKVSSALKPLEESFDEGIVMEEGVSSDGDDVMVVGVDGTVKIRDEQIVSVLKAELQRSPSSHWNIPRAMRGLRRVFGEAVTSKESLVQKKLQELQCSQRWLLPPPPTVSFKCCGMEITQEDLNTLLPGRWVNDQVINCYMRLLMESFGRKRVHIVSTFFYTKLRTTGYKGVERWLKKIDLLRLRLLLVPVHLGHHWCLAAVDFRKKVFSPSWSPCLHVLKIEYFDSLGGRNRICLKRLLVLLLKCAQRRGCRMKNGWKRCYPKGIPRQSNFSDCGVFACQFARWLCSSQFGHRSKIPFHQEHMPLIRTTMAHELRTEKLVQYKL